MHRLSILSTIALCALFVISPAFSQTVTVVNSASSANQALPNGSIAQGSIFVGYGPAGMGPGSIVLPAPWPFPTELGGTSIKVTVGGTTVDCFMVYSVAGQVAAILPSNTPVGSGTVAVMFNGSVAATGPINVVASSFGIFSLNQQGTGPVVATNPTAGDAVYTTSNSVALGNFIDIWGTGLGPVTFPDEGPTTVADLRTPNFDVKLYIAGVEIPVLYAGRSGCCSAVDLVRGQYTADSIQAINSSDLNGCFLPVTVVAGGVTSNFTTIAMNPDGGQCVQDPLFGGPDLSQLQNGGTLRTGDIGLIRQRTEFVIPDGQGQLQDLVTDFANANYQETTITNVNWFSGIVPVSQIGACTVYQFSGENPDPPGLPNPTPLDAGNALTLEGPGGPKMMPRLGGGYSVNLSLPTFPFLSPETKEQFSFPTYFVPGLTTVTAPGGADVGAHTASLNVPQDLVWTNKQVAAGPVSRNSSLTLQYQAAGYDFLNIFGFAPALIDADNTVGAGFFCVGDPSAGSFTIPQQVMMAMPNTPLIEGNGSGGISISGVKTNSFTAPGTDTNSINYVDQTLQLGTDFN